MNELWSRLWLLSRSLLRISKITDQFFCDKLRERIRELNKTKSRLTSRLAVDYRLWWNSRAVLKAPILQWDRHWEHFHRRIPATNERPRWSDWSLSGMSDLASAFPLRCKSRRLDQNSMQLTNCFKQKKRMLLFFFLIGVRNSSFFCTYLLQYDYSITWCRFRISLVKHSSSHRAQICSYVNSSFSYFALTFLINRSSFISSSQIELFSMLFPPSFGITITWPNRPATSNRFNWSLTKNHEMLPLIIARGDWVVDYISTNMARKSNYESI